MNSTPRESRVRVIVTGLIAQYPLGGVAWDYLQYVVGLANLGHDVYYFEDTGQWPYNPQEGGISQGCQFNIKYLAKLMDCFGLADRWAYKFPWQSQWFGLGDSERRDLVASADLLINVSGTLATPSDYRSVKRLVYIDSDPVFTQVKLARGQKDFKKLVDAHDQHFSFGETLSSCIPATGHRWIPTRQPVVINEWEHTSNYRETFTTIMNWSSYKPVMFNGHTYGQKDIEFQKFVDLPSKVAPTRLELAISAGKVTRTPKSWLSEHGWDVVDPDQVCFDHESYRSFIQSSKAEWSVAKNGYVEGRSGWFSCRSACYLAAGRPVVVQDTGFSDVLPVGMGLLAFTTCEEAAQAINDVNSSYSRHSMAAREIAVAYFDANKVLTRLIEVASSDKQTHRET